DPIIANAIGSAALLVAIVLPLALGILMVRGMFQAPESETLNELLIMELGFNAPLSLCSSPDPIPPLQNPQTSLSNLDKHTVLPPTEAQTAESAEWRRVGEPRTLVVVEGVNDVAFLRKISAMLHASDPAIPAIGELADSNQVVLLPAGGGNFEHWVSPLEGMP